MGLAVCICVCFACGRNVNHLWSKDSMPWLQNMAPKIFDTSPFESWNLCPFPLILAVWLIKYTNKDRSQFLFTTSFISFLFHLLDPNQHSDWSGFFAWLGTQTLIPGGSLCLVVLPVLDFYSLPLNSWQKCTEVQRGTSRESSGFHTYIPLSV